MTSRFFMTLILSSLLASASACDSEIDDLKSSRLSSNIPVTETDGVVTGTVSATASTNQIMVASASSKIADSAVTFPPGALTISTEIALGEASDKSTAILAELGVTGAVDATTPVYAGPASGTPPALGEALTIQLPLPLEDMDADLVQGAAATSKLALVYLIYSGSWKAGIIPLTEANLSGAFVKQNLAGLGYFQLVYFASEKGEKEATSQVRPGLNGKQTQGD